jgi:hypothetical protein
MIRAKVFALMAFGGLLFAWPTRVQAQAPPGPQSPTPPPGVKVPAAKPLPPPPPLPPPRQTILGDWKLNRDQSDDMRGQSDDQGSNSGGYGRRSGGGYPGGGYPGGGYPGGGGGMPRGDSEAVREKLHELLSPPMRIALSMTGAEVDLMDDQDRKRAFVTDGRKLQKPKDNSYQEIAARWDGKSLVTDEKSPRGGKMSRRFELSEDGRQLNETIRMDNGKNGATRTYRFVYDIPVASTSR